MIPTISFSIVIGSRALTISHDTQWRLISVSGLEAADIVTSVQNYQQIDGGYFASQRVSPRKITIKLGCFDRIMDRQTVEDLRQEMISFWRPHIQGQLMATRNGITRVIDFHLNGKPQFTQDNIQQKWPEVSVELICPEAYFRDDSSTSVSFNAVAPLFSFPYISPSGIGVTSGILVSSNSCTAANGGDVPAGFRITISIDATGTLVNPRVSNSAGEFVEVLGTFSGQHIIVIDTCRGEKGVTVDGEPYYKFSRDSSFFELASGDTDLAISADSGVNSAAFTCTFKRLWLGV